MDCHESQEHSQSATAMSPAERSVPCLVVDVPIAQGYTISGEHFKRKLTM